MCLVPIVLHLLPAETRFFHNFVVWQLQEAPTMKCRGYASSSATSNSTRTGAPSSFCTIFPLAYLVPIIVTGLLLPYHITKDVDVRPLCAVHGHVVSFTFPDTSRLQFYWPSGYYKAHPPPIILFLIWNKYKRAGNRFILDMKSSGQIWLHSTRTTHKISRSSNFWAGSLVAEWIAQLSLKHVVAVPAAHQGG